ncbi:flavohemo protein [Periconia macrospinosa]|uniref:nitric oxide dioxygenase n=1 Tax=Periconia macrospinosa TaxID=97972 RepID=A0A2V1D8D6_9PLEO|nr:flavohemo protein [Periconia macrospinosa]
MAPPPHAPLTPSQTAIIKSTVPILAAHGKTITTHFYASVLRSNPSLKSVFNNTHQATGHQASALAGALHAYASHIDDLGALSPAIQLITNKHASLCIQPAQYEVVGTYLLQSMKSVLGDATATPEVMEAWEAAYWQLADVLVAKEDALYKSTKGWDGWRDFRIARKERESVDITSFYLEPIEDEEEEMWFKPGQYVSVNIFVDELDGGVWQARQYSLSDAPGKGYLRISVKREAAIEIGEPRYMAEPGYLSNILHDRKEVGDVVRVTHPFGDFYLEEGEGGDDDGPVVLVSAGVGLTCLMSILKTVVEGGSKRPVAWIHGARDERSRAFRGQVEGMKGRDGGLKTVFFSSSPEEGEVEGRDYDVKGRVDLDRVGKDVLFTDNDKALYFVCGPTQFMLDVESKLKSFGVSGDRIKMELFGTGGVPKV